MGQGRFLYSHSAFGSMVREIGRGSLDAFVLSLFAVSIATSAAFIVQGSGLTLETTRNVGLLWLILALVLFAIWLFGLQKLGDESKEE